MCRTHSQTYRYNNSFLNLRPYEPLPYPCDRRFESDTSVERCNANGSSDRPTHPLAV
ncbi:hypothetical protein H6G89_04150 [Oscillatoria sp. FACHB-1407]|nr:hypothetical protein [Oscillatoria sp. FACHB-1407]